MHLHKKWLSTVFALLLFLTAFPVAVLGETPPAPPEEREAGEQVADTVQLSVTGDGGREMYPGTPVEIEAGETAFSVLLKTLGPDQVIYTGSGSTLYVRAIGGLAEFDRGPLSGWMYRVNGEFPPHSAGVHPLAKGDVVEWVYTTDGGGDVGFPLSRTGGEGNNRLREAPESPSSGRDSPSLTPGEKKPESRAAETRQRAPETDRHEEKPGPAREVEEASSDKVEASSLPERDLSQAVADVVGWISAEGSGSDWQALGLFQATGKVPANYLENTARYIEENNGEFRKVTDYERMVLGIRAAGGDPSDIGGYNLIEKIYNNERMTLQGSNGVIFALIALDSARDPVPEDALWTREKLLNWLLENQNGDGSWALVAGSRGDVDITAMALAALAPYDGAAVDQAKQKGFRWLSSQQTENGGFLSWGVENSESASQVIIALTANRMDPKAGAFTQPGGNVLQNLLSYQQKDGGFAHTATEGSNDMASEQALLALTSYRNHLAGKPGIYDLSDIHTSPGEEEKPDPTPPDPKPTPAPEPPEGGKTESPQPGGEGGKPGSSRTLSNHQIPGMGGGPPESIGFLRTPVFHSGSSAIPSILKGAGIGDVSGKPTQNPTKEDSGEEQITEQTLASSTPVQGVPDSPQSASSPHRGYVMILLGVLFAFVGAGYYLYERRRSWQ